MSWCYTFRHRAINLFLKSYRVQWLDNEEYEKKILIDDLTVLSLGFLTYTVMSPDFINILQVVI